MLGSMNDCRALISLADDSGNANACATDELDAGLRIMSRSCNSLFRAAVQVLHVLLQFLLGSRVGY